MTTTPQLDPASVKHATMTIPAQSPLPPSPTITGAVLDTLLPNLSLDETVSRRNGIFGLTTDNLSSQTVAVVNRLRSIAKYDSSNTALACSSDIFASGGGGGGGLSSTGSSTASSSSLAAIGGPQGLTLFPISRPSHPLVVFPHAMSSSSSISSLSFRPGTSSSSSSSSTSDSTSAVLAAARGSGVLLFDASGHSPNPLLGRLVVDPFVNGGGGSSGITSIGWKTTTPSQNAVLLACTTESSLSLWDLRLSTTNGSSFQPALKFGASNQTVFGDSGQRVSAPLVSTACSSSPSSEECATLDANGVVRIYDLRMTERGSSSVSALGSGTAAAELETSGSPVVTFAAHGAGMGIFYLPPDSGTKESPAGSTWVTFGLESPPPLGHPVVKVWRGDRGTDRLQLSTSSFHSTDDYWYLGTGDDMKSFASPLRKNDNNTHFSSSNDYHVIARYERPNLSCARLCPSPMKDSFVVVGYKSQNENNEGQGWWAEMLRLSDDDFTISSPDQSRESFGVEPVAKFSGGDASTLVENNQTLGSVLGRSKVGNLKAAELAISSMDDRPTALINDGTNKRGDYQDGQAELILCCLSDTGIITTTAIPEADSQLAAAAKNQRTKGGTPRRRAKRTAVRSTLPSLSSQLRVFPESRAGSSLLDAAGLYGNSDTNLIAKADSTLFRTETVNDRRPVSPVKPIRAEQEQRLFPFDMEVPVPVTSNNQTGITDNTTVVGSSLVGSAEKLESQMKDEVSLVENIDTGRVPCPPLCGAAFGRNGLVVFRNGKVHTMWEWYQKSDTKREISHSTSEELEESLETNRKFAFGPRSFKDLINMCAAAKDGQWTDDDLMTDDDALSGINPFEDDSDSNSSDDEDDSNEEDDDTYKKYFGNAWKNTIEQKSDRPSTSDMLQPVVTLLHEFDSSRRENRAVYFAENWKLSNWNCRRLNRVRNRTMGGYSHTNRKDEVASKSPLPHYRDLATLSPTRGEGIAKAQSDPTLAIHPTPEENTSSVIDDPGVHRGQFPPNRLAHTESMTFLKKLLVSQQKGSGSTLPSLTSPPDSPGLVLSRGVSSKRQGGVSSNIAAAETAGADSKSLGVHTIRADPLFNDQERANRIEEVCNICLHNATVCRGCDDQESFVVWKLLEQSLRYQLKNQCGKFNGWGGTGGGALGSGIVSNVLAYYEGIGDVQMLASIYCVLDAIDSSGGGILPEGRQDDYDTYIRRYAELLFGYGLLNVRAEVCKHLSRKTSRFLNEFILKASDGQNMESRNGFGIVISCPKCKNAVNRDTNYCTHCRDLALRCCLCETSVRGMLTLCEQCGHGGHLSHIMTWFKTQSYCPSGCGCQCNFQFDSGNTNPVGENIPVESET